jgi:hypothetical protein
LRHRRDRRKSRFSFQQGLQTIADLPDRMLDKRFITLCFSKYSLLAKGLENRFRCENV